MGELGSHSVQAKPAKRYAVRYAVKSDVGQVRSENQDSYGLTRTHRSDLFVVADGMGGAGGGATASTIAVNVVTRTALQPDGQVTEESLSEAIQRTHNAIYQASLTEEGLTKMGTTVVALAINGRNAVIGHVGDSRLYLWREGQICQLTRDHTLVQELVDSGTISPSDAENHPMAHYLTRSLSPESSARAEVHTYPNPVEIGDRYLLCCDGLYNLVSEEDVARILSEHSIDEAADILVNLANERGGTDNITVELIEIERLLEDGEVVGPAPGEPEIVVSTEYSTSFLSDQAKEIIRSAIVGVSQSNGAPAAESDDSDEKADVAAGSAVDGLLFSAANPTREDIERHEQRFKVPGAIPVLNSGERPEPAVGAAEPSAEPSPEEFIAQEERQLRKFVVGLCVVVFFAVVGAASFLMLNRERLFPGKSNEVSPSTKLAGQLATESRPAEISPEPSSASDLPVTAVETAVPADHPVDVPTVENPTGTDAPSIPVIASTSPETVVINPAVTAVEGERLTRDAMFERLKNETSALPPEAAVKAASELEQMRALIAQVASLELPAAPDTSKDTPAPNPDQPIDWEREREFRDAANEPAPVETNSAPATVLVGEELQAIINQKAELRDKVSDLDAKIRLAALGTKADAEREIALLEAEGKELDPAIGFAERNYQLAEQRIKRAVERQAIADRHDKDSVLKLAEQISSSSAMVQEKKAAYELASLRYTETVEQWTENSGNAELAGTMAQRGRELRARRSNLEEAVIQAVGLELREAQYDLGEWGVVLNDLKHRKDLINRHVGFLQAFTPPVAKDGARAGALKELLEERTRLVSAMSELQKQLSDTDESASRRATVLEQLSAQNR